MPNGTIARNGFHYVNGSFVRSAIKGSLDATVLIPQRNLQVENLFAMTLKAEMARLNNASMNGADGDLVHCAVHGPVTPLLQFLAARDVVELDSRELTLEEVFLSEFESAP